MVKVALLFLALISEIFVGTFAQYENYSFSHFPEEDLMSLSSAYGSALDKYAVGNWTESILSLELSLRLHRLLKDSARFCTRLCKNKQNVLDFTTVPALRGDWDIMMSASCQKKCRRRFPALQIPPSRNILQEFIKRSPYRYLHHAYAKLNNLQRAVPCAYTFLQRNPEDQEMHQLMEEYKKEYDLDGFLIDHEQQPYEVSFVKGVKLLSSSDYSSSVEHLEETLRLYLQEFDLCQSDCEGIAQLSSDGDFYSLLADVYIDVLRCKLKCEENLTPNVGGYFVEKFVATIYHHLQYAYYKLNDGWRAVPCAQSYFLFEPDDQIMKQNLLYYEAFKDQWGLLSDHFTPRVEAFKHFNQTVTQKRMLALTESYMKLGDEDFFGPEDAALLSSESPDEEFEGLGDYEESILANWRQPKGKGDVGQSDI